MSANKRTKSFRADENRYRDEVDRVPPQLEQLVAPMIDSFDWFLDNFESAIKAIPPRAFIVDRRIVYISFDSLKLRRPDRLIDKDVSIYPAEVRVFFCALLASRCKPWCRSF